MTRGLAAWVAGVVRHRRWVLFGSALLCLICALSLRALRLDFDVLSMLPRGEPAFDDYRAFIGDFGHLDELVLLVRADRAEDARAVADALAERLRRIDMVTRVDARIDTSTVGDDLLGRHLYNYLPLRAYDELERQLNREALAARVRGLRGALAAPLDLQAARAIAADPLQLRRAAARSFGGDVEVVSALRDGYLSADDGRAVLVIVRPAASGFDAAFSSRLLEAVEAAAQATKAELGIPAVRVAATGSYAFAREDASTLRADIYRYIVLALVGVLGVFLAAYRSPRILPFVAYPLLVTTLLTFAAGLVIYGQFNALSLSFAAILYGLSIDTGIYFYTQLQQARSRGLDPQAAVLETVATLVRGDLAANLTSAAVFAVIGLSSLTAVQQLGWLSAIGMLVNVAQFFTLYPALGFIAASRQETPESLETPRLARLGCWSARHPTAVSATAVLGGIGLLFLARAGFDVELTHLRPRDSEAAAVQEEISSLFGGRDLSGAVLAEGATLEEALRAGETATERLEAYKRDQLVARVSSAAGVLPSAAAQKARLKRFEGLPRSEAASALRAELAEQGFQASAFEPFLNDFERSRTELIRIDDPALDPLEPLIHRHVRVHPDGSAVVAVYFEPSPDSSLARVGARLRADLPDLSLVVTGRPLFQETMARVLRYELLLFLGLSLASNALILVVVLGRPVVAAAVLAPIVLVLLAVFAVMRLAGMTLDPVTLSVIPLLLGLGVDNGCYVAGAAARGGLEAALRKGGRPLVTTTLTTVAGFGFLGLSRYPALASMGQLAGVGLLACMVVTILFLPAFLQLARVGVATGRE